MHGLLNILTVDVANCHCNVVHKLAQMGLIENLICNIIAGYLVLRGFECIEVNRDTIQTFGIITGDTEACTN